MYLKSGYTLYASENIFTIAVFIFTSNIKLPSNAFSFGAKMFILRKNQGEKKQKWNLIYREQTSFHPKTFLNVSSLDGFCFLCFTTCHRLYNKLVKALLPFIYPLFPAHHFLHRYPVYIYIYTYKH